MAGAAGMYLRAAVKVLFLSAIFIILSADVGEGRRCFWCGPLAEQVHRSLRAPPCASGARHVTICEPGYDYCAIVAMSPPYLESRYCVKMYQDECYPLFCNSTKTWKMTCPCRGDLCNGANAEREKDAFAVLDKLLVKTHSRTKRDSTRLTGNRKGRIVNPRTYDKPILDGNNYTEENNSQKIEKVMETLTVNNQSEGNAQSSISSTSNSPLNNATSSSHLSMQTDNEYLEITTSGHPSVVGERSEDDESNLSTTSEQGVTDKDTKLTCNVMIKIDIQSNSTVQDHMHDITNQTTTHEIRIQADDPEQQNDQSEVVNEMANNNKDQIHESEREENTPIRSTPESLKIYTFEVVNTSPSYSSSNSEVEANSKEKPTESTPTNAAQDAEFPTDKSAIEKTHNQNEITMMIKTEIEAVPSTITPVKSDSGIGKNVDSNTIELSIEKKKNHDTGLYGNTCVIIQLIIILGYIM